MITNLLFFAASLVAAYLTITLSASEPRRAPILVRSGRPDESRRH